MTYDCSVGKTEQAGRFVLNGEGWAVPQISLFHRKEGGVVIGVVVLLFNFD